MDSSFNVSQLGGFPARGAMGFAGVNAGLVAPPGEGRHLGHVKLENKPSTVPKPLGLRRFPTVPGGHRLSICVPFEE